MFNTINHKRGNNNEHLDRRIPSCNDSVHHLGRKNQQVTINVGDEVTVKGIQGTFIVRNIRDEQDGQVIGMFGGSKNPLGHRSFRFFTADRVRRVPVKRNRRKDINED